LEFALIAGLKSFVSAPRAQRYRNAGVDDLEAVALYCWNTQLAETLLPSIAMLEVCLRNSVHDALTAHAGTEWWFKPALTTERYGNILELVGRLTKRAGYPPTVGKVISEITFGFWPRLFAQSYNSLWWSQPNPLIRTVLPHHPNIGRDTRKRLEERLEYVVELRNRAVHHEAIFRGVAALNRPVLPIETLHEHLIETIGWISLDAKRIVVRFDRFDDVFGSLSATIAEIDDEFHVS